MKMTTTQNNKELLMKFPGGGGAEGIDGTGGDGGSGDGDK